MAFWNRNKGNAPQTVTPPGLYTAGDSSGMLTLHVSPRQSRVNLGSLGLNILKKFVKTSEHVAPYATTNSAGHAGSAAPSLYETSLLQLRYDRRSVIADARLAIRDDLRARKSTLFYAREATRGGCTISIDEAGLSKLPKRQQEAIRESAGRIQRIVNAEVLSWGWMLPVEGDLFIQLVPTGNKITAAKRMPAASMERLSDDTDEFPNPREAFAQVDIVSEEELARFPLGLMIHERWNHISGERYGESELVAVRRTRRVLELTEAAQAVRRMARAPKRTHWKIGTPDKVGQPGDIEEFRKTNGFVEGKMEVFDPANVALSYFSNGMVSSESIDGDGGVDSIRDIEYLQDTYAAGLPTPGALWNLGASNVNRDVLEDQRAEWLKTTSTLSDALKRVIQQIWELDLLFQGILPELAPVTIGFSESTIEKPTERVERVLKLLGFTFGSMPFPLITVKQALVLLADVLGIDDVDIALEEITKQRKDLVSMLKETQEAMAPPEPAMPPGAAPGATSPGRTPVTATRPPVRSGMSRTAPPPSSPVRRPSVARTDEEEFNYEFEVP